MDLPCREALRSQMLRLPCSLLLLLHLQQQQLPSRPNQHLNPLALVSEGEQLMLCLIL